MAEDVRTYDSDPGRKVLCRLCSLKDDHVEFAASSLTGHVGSKHKMSKADYIKKFPQARNDFAVLKQTPAFKQAALVRIQAINEAKKAEDTSVPAPITEGDGNATFAAASLTGPERAFYDEYYATLFNAVDRDEVQVPAVSSLVFDIIYLRRLRDKQFKDTKGTKYTADIDKMEQAMKMVEDRIRKQMATLGVSREAQLKRNTQIKSTPASLIAGYLDEIEITSPESLKALELEEKRVVGKMMARIDRFILSQAPDLKPEESESEDGVELGAPLTLEQALNRADITF